MTLPFVSTFFEEVQHVSAYAGAAGPKCAEEQHQQAVLDAYDTLTRDYQWRHFVARDRIFFQAPYSTGTVSYNSDTLKLTLASGTFPTWAAHGCVKIGNVISKVDTRESGSVLKLDADQNPQQDVAALTTYVLYRVTYPLPDDLERLFDVFPEGQWCQPAKIGHTHMQRLERDWQYGQGYPAAYDIEPDPRRMNGWQLRVFGYPTEGKTFDISYYRAARPLVYAGNETEAKAGTVTCVQSTALQGASTTFADDMAGSMVLFSRNGTDLPDARSAAKKYAEKARIERVGGDGDATLYAATTKSHSAVKYRITDPIDLPNALMEAMRRCAEWKLEVARHGSSDQAERRYNNELFRAMGVSELKIEARPSDRGGPWASYSIPYDPYQLSGALTS